MKLKQGQPRHGTTLKKSIGLSLEISVIEQLNRMAKERELTRSRIVSEIIQDYLLNQKSGEKPCQNSQKES